MAVRLRAGGELVAAAGAAGAEDLAFRYLAGGAGPDHWTLNEFRRHHRRAINDLFTPVLELARDAGLGRLGHVAIDSTRVAANASRNRVESEDALARAGELRREIRRWQQQCDAADPDEMPGTHARPDREASRGAAVGGDSPAPAEAAQGGAEETLANPSLTAAFCANGKGSRWAIRWRWQ